ncbi:MAG: LPS assembly lipoprotein LptE [bacterium]
MLNRVAFLLAVLSLVGCGFQLRSYSFSGAVDSFALIGKTQLGVAQPLRSRLSQAGLQEVEAGQADMIVKLLDQRRDRRSVSTAGRARAAEYESSYAVLFRLLNGQGQELAPANWIERQRVFRIDADNIVGSSEEQALLERELMSDVVGQIVRAMEAVSRASVNAG